MRFFPFEFFRSRFRRMSMRKVGDVNEEPLHILPSNGGRTDGTLFEFQGEVAESTSIENILKRKLRQAEFLEDTDEASRILNTLKVLQSRPTQLTKDRLVTLSLPYKLVKLSYKGEDGIRTHGTLKTYIRLAI